MSALESRGIGSVGTGHPFTSTLYGMAIAWRRGTDSEQTARDHRDRLPHHVPTLAEAARVVLIAMCQHVSPDATADDLAVIDRWRRYVNRLNALRFFTGVCGDCLHCIPADEDAEDMCEPDRCHPGSACENE